MKFQKEILTSMMEHCPVCEQKLYCSITIKTKSNTKEFSLKENCISYPFIFRPIISFADSSEEVLIDDKDQLTFNIPNVEIVSCFLTCSTLTEPPKYRYHYNLCLFKFYVNTNECLSKTIKLSGLFFKPYEKISAHGFSIINSYIFDTSKVFDNSKRYEEELFTIPRQSISYWDLSDKELFTQRIHALLLLK